MHAEVQDRSFDHEGKTDAEEPANEGTPNTSKEPLVVLELTIIVPFKDDIAANPDTSRESYEDRHIVPNDGFPRLHHAREFHGVKTFLVCLAIVDLSMLDGVGRLILRRLFVRVIHLDIRHD